MECPVAKRGCELTLGVEILEARMEAVFLLMPA